MKDALQFHFILLLKWIQDFLLDPILNLLFKTTTKNGPQNSERKYANSAQRVKIRTRGAYSVGTFHSLENYLYTHQSYCHPNVVLKNDRITLQGVDDQFAWFCITEDSVDVNDVTQFPFVWIAQYLMATELIIMPISSFLQLYQEELVRPGNDGRQIIMLFNTTRCGSTLACQMFSKLPNTKSMSEPWPLLIAHSNYVHGNLKAEIYEDIIEACVAFQCKADLGIQRIFYKPPGAAMPVAHIVKKMCPNIKVIFNTRLPKHNVSSLYQIINGPVYESSTSPEIKTIWKRFVALPPHPKDMTKALKKYRNEVIAKLDIDKMDLYIGGCFSSYFYWFLQHRDIYDFVLLYDEWMHYPLIETAKLFDSLGIDKKHLSVALEAFDKDSQNKFFGETDGKRAEVISEDEWRRIDEVFQTFGLPLKHDMSIEEYKSVLYQ